MTLAKSIDRLEQSGSRKDLPPVIRIIADVGESSDDAIARYRAAHPEAPEDVFFIVRVLVSPQHGEIRP